MIALLCLLIILAVQLPLFLCDMGVFFCMKMPDGRLRLWYHRMDPRDPTGEVGLVGNSWPIYEDPDLINETLAKLDPTGKQKVPLTSIVNPQTGDWPGNKPYYFYNKSQSNLDVKSISPLVIEAADGVRCYPYTYGRELRTQAENKSTATDKSNKASLYLFGAVIKQMFSPSQPSYKGSWVIYNNEIVTKSGMPLASPYSPAWDVSAIPSVYRRDAQSTIREERARQRGGTFTEAELERQKSLRQTFNSTVKSRPASLFADSVLEVPSPKRTSSRDLSQMTLSPVSARSSSAAKSDVSRTRGSRMPAIPEGSIGSSTLSIPPARSVNSQTERSRDSTLSVPPARSTGSSVRNGSSIPPSPSLSRGSSLATESLKGPSRREPSLRESIPPIASRPSSAWENGSHYGSVRDSMISDNGLNDPTARAWLAPVSEREKSRGQSMGGPSRSDSVRSDATIKPGQSRLSSVPSRTPTVSSASSRTVTPGSSRAPSKT